MLISPLELEFLGAALGIDIPNDPYELAQLLPELYYISQNIHKGVGLPPGYASLVATNTSATRNLNRAGIDDLPANYSNLGTPGTINPQLANTLSAMQRTMQPASITGPRPQDQTQIDRDQAAEARGLQQGQHLGSAAPVVVDLPGYSPNGGGYSLLNTLHNIPIPPSARYAYGANY